MAEVVNLRLARKAKARDAAAKAADANRAAFGRTKAEKAGALAEVGRIGRTLDQAQRER